MEAEDLKLGDKVVPLKRTIDTGEFPVTHSVAWRAALAANQPYLFVERINFDTTSGVPRVLCSVDADGSSMMADWFEDADLVQYTE